MKKGRDALVQGTRRLFEPIQGAREQADVVGMRVVDKAGGLLAVHMFIKMSMKKVVRNVHLVNWPCSRHPELEDGADRAWFYNRREGVGEVNARMLPEASHHPTSLISSSVPTGRSL